MRCAESGIDQKLNGALPLDASFTDESGRPVQLRQFFQGTRPVLLSLVYYQCPMLCNMVLNGETRTMREMKLEPGRDYDVVTISFDSKEKTALAAAKKATYVEKLGKPGAADAWHFLTGDEENIRSLTQSVGFRYRWDDTTKQWAHASGIIVVTPDARISRYLYGVDFQPRDLRLALVEASKNKIGRITDQILLLCYHYDPAAGQIHGCRIQDDAGGRDGDARTARRIRVHQPASGQALESLICTSEFFPRWRPRSPKSTIRCSGTSRPSP